MKDILKKFKLLQIFAEGGGDGGSAGAPGADGAGSAVNGFANQKGNDLSHVVYGKAVEGDPVAAEVTDGNNSPDLDAEFKALVKGKYREQYGKAVKSAVDDRFKSTQESVDKFNKAAPLFEILANKHGIDAGDIDGLIKAVEEDDSYYEEEALQKGMSVSQLKEVKRMERENAQLKSQMENSNAKAQADQIFAQWAQDAQKAQQLYPQLDFETEIHNPQIAQLLRSGVPFQTAYEVVHKDEIIPHAMQVAVQNSAGKLANSVIAGSRRPQEGAAANSSSAVVKSDPSKLTYADRREIEKRVARGERIVF